MARQKFLEVVSRLRRDARVKIRLTPRMAWAILGYTVLVILWGAFVRATGSGAGCGAHWPLCDGQVLPRTFELDRAIEFTHRLTSGANLFLLVLLALGAWSTFPKGHRVRRGAAWSLGFIFSEALVGAGLVLFGWVAKNDSVSRAVVLSIHLCNTLGLVAAISVTALWVSRPNGVRGFRPTTPGLLALCACVLVGVTGAIAALGDTLFPAQSLAEGLRQDASPLAHFLIRLRLVHPVLAVAVGAWMILYAQSLRERVGGLAHVLTLAVIAQLGLGVLNVALLAPIWLQLVHLLMADTVWVSLVLLVASEGDLPAAEKSRVALSQA